MSVARNPTIRRSAWSPEVARLEKELAASHAREQNARRELQETRERFERILSASKKFISTVSSERQQQRISRRVDH